MEGGSDAENEALGRGTQTGHKYTAGRLAMPE